MKRLDFFFGKSGDIGCVSFSCLKIGFFLFLFLCFNQLKEKETRGIEKR